MGRLYDEDVDWLARSADVPWEELDGSHVVITGATGLVGGMLARAILARNDATGARTTLTLPVRNLPKAIALFGDRPDLRLVPWDAESPDAVSLGSDPSSATPVFIVHCASNTDSRRMLAEPVNTILATVEGTRSMLELARRTGARLCFVSSMEVYGAGSPDPVDETCGGALDAMSVRSCYPQAKQLAETLCASYASQFGVSACVARLAQSFGPGIAPTDRRVFAEFARCCEEGRDIALLTDGSKSNMYVYTADAVAALLTLVVRGEAGEAYNVANPETFCSVWQMARMVADAFGRNTQVTRVVDEEAARRYAVSGRIWLATNKICALGWHPTRDLRDMYERMMDDWAEPTEEQRTIERQTQEE